MKHCPQCSGSYPDEYVACPKDGARLPSVAPWDPDSVIRGKYKILEKLGQGGMASVYKAHHELLDEPRALKVIHPELARDEQFVKRFKNEAINTRKLQHPNAVRVDDLDIAEDGRPFIAMEMVEGESLKSLVLRVGPLPVAQVVDITLQMCDGLGTAHALGLTHRDIKPDNIVLLPTRDSKQFVKILDFGIARLKEASLGAGSAGSTLTETGVVIGTPEYMSPEQAMGKRGDDIDGRSDLYSLGIVMYRMLTGELPFKAESTLEMILHHIQDLPQPPQNLKPQLGIPASISAIIMKALEKDREKRFASAGAMAEALRQAQREIAANGARPAQEETVVVRSPSVAVAAAALPPAAAVSSAVPQAPSGSVNSPAPQPRSGAAIRPAAKPVSANPALRPLKQEMKFPIIPTAAGAGVLAIVVLGAMWFMRQPSQVDPAANSPADRAAKSALQAADTSHGKAPISPLSKSGSKLKPPAKSRANDRRAPILNENSSNPSSRNLTRASANTERSNGSSPVSSLGIDSNSGSLNKNGVPQVNQELANSQKPPNVLRNDVRGNIRPMNDKASELFIAGKYLKAAEIYRNVLLINPSNERAQRGLKSCIQKIRARRTEKTH